MNKIYKVELIDKYLKENKISKTAFCKLNKISPSTLKNIYLQNGNISLPRVFKIIDTLKVKTKDFFY